MVLFYSIIYDSVWLQNDINVLQRLGLRDLRVGGIGFLQQSVTILRVCLCVCSCINVQIEMHCTRASYFAIFMCPHYIYMYILGCHIMSAHHSTPNFIYLPFFFSVTCCDRVWWCVLTTYITGSSVWCLMASRFAPHPFPSALLSLCMW